MPSACFSQKLTTTVASSGPTIRTVKTTRGSPRTSACPGPVRRAIAAVPSAQAALKRCHSSS